MKILIACICACFIMATPFKIVSADESRQKIDESVINKYISSLYSQIDFKGHDRLSFDVFSKAVTGYINLRNSGKLNTDKHIISVCDFNLPSTENRLWIIDLSAKKVLFNTLVAHGQGSGEDCATEFSNNFNSHQSSLGFYVTGDTYNGEHGISLRLNGMDAGFNDAALERGIVVHGADYVSNKFVAGNERLGRSWGCPAVPDQLKVPIINTIEGGTCLFIYHADVKYQKTAFWMNKKPDHLPENDAFDQMMMTAQAKPASKKYTIQYIHNGKIDSVKTISEN